MPLDSSSHHPRVPLGEVADIGAGQGAPQDPQAFGRVGLPFIRAASLATLCGDCDGPELEHIEDVAAKKHGLRLYPAGTVVFAKSGMSATKNRICRLERPAYVVNHLATIEPHAGLDAVYLRYWLEKFNPTRLIQDDSYPSIAQADIAEVQIPLPDLPAQRRIAGILGKADRLRRMRRYALELSDQFLPALFLRMFGDPATNAHGWETVSLDELLSTDPQNGIYKPESDYGSGTPILRIDAFYDGVVTGLSALKRVRLSPEEVAVYRLAGGNIVVNRVNSPEFLGKSALIPALKEPTVFESNMMRLDVNEANINRVYLIHFLQTAFVRRQILTAAKNAVNQSSINQQDVRALSVRRPERKWQDQFARAVLEHGRRAAIHREALRQAEHLFHSLLNQYFGEDQSES